MAHVIVPDIIIVVSGDHRGRGAKAPIRLTELIKQHFGVLELRNWFATKTRFWHKTSRVKIMSG